MAGIGKDERLAPPADLLVLERGAEEILLCHPVLLEPVYMPRGGAFVKKLLRDIGGGLTRSALSARYRGHEDLLRLLERHHIVTAPASACPAKPRRSASAGHDRMAVYLTVTTACNMSCVYCLGGNRQRPRKPENMPFAVACRAVEKACREVNPGGTVEVTFFGGEPLCNWPLVKATGEYVRRTLAPCHPDITISLTMISNLVELPDDLAEWSFANGMSFICDVDGFAAAHDRLRPCANGEGSWRRITDNIRRLTASGVPVGLRMTLTALNQAEMKDTAMLFKELGATSCAFVPVQPVDIDGGYLAAELIPDIAVLVAGLKETYAAGIWGPEELFPLADFRSRMQAGGAGPGPGCGSFSGQTPVVVPSGEIYPCVYLAGDRRFRCGSAAGDSAAGEALLSGLRERLTVANLPECRVCPWRSLCGGGCSVPRLLLGPDTDAPEGVRRYAREVNCAFVTAAYEILMWERATAAYAALNGGSPLRRGGGGGVC